MGSEWRQDPLRGTWVVIAPDRAGRPDEFPERAPSAARASACPFCEGNERETPAEILVRRGAGDPNGPGWTVRVVDNKYPAVGRDGAPEEVPVDAFVRRGGFGAHEVIVESPRHAASLTDLREPEVAEVIRVYRERLRSLREDPRLAYAVVFKNVGAQAGASVEHVHSQLLALPFVPAAVRTELDRSAAYRKEHGSCLRCDLIRSETKAGRKILESERFTAYAPYASRLPYETHVVPRAHEPRFEEMDEAGIAELSRCLLEAVGRIERIADRPAYNYVFRTAPLNEGPVDHYHWSVEILPRVTRLAGFEWGTGVYINPVPPEEAARRLREG